MRAGTWRRATAGLAILKDALDIRQAASTASSSLPPATTEPTTRSIRPILRTLAACLPERQCAHRPGERPLRCQGVFLQLREEHRPSRRARQRIVSTALYLVDPPRYADYSGTSAAAAFVSSAAALVFALNPPTGTAPAGDPAPDCIGRDDDGLKLACIDGKRLNLRRRSTAPA